jgi:hypothetical protein
LTRRAPSGSDSRSSTWVAAAALITTWGRSYNLKSTDLECYLRRSSNRLPAQF